LPDPRHSTPLKSADWAGVTILLAIGTAGTVGALAAMRRRDVGA